MKIIDAVNFCRANGVQPEWTNDQLCIGIKNAISACSIVYSVDANGNLNGLAFGKWSNNATAIHAYGIAGQGTPRLFLRYLRKVHPQCKTLTWNDKDGKAKSRKLL